MVLPCLVLPLSYECCQIIKNWLKKHHSPENDPYMSYISARR